MRRRMAGLTSSASFMVHRVGAGVCSSSRCMKTLDAASREREVRSGPNSPKLAEGVFEQVLHLVEQEERAIVVGNQALCQLELLKSLLA